MNNPLNLPPAEAGTNATLRFGKVISSQIYENAETKKTKENKQKIDDFI